MSIADIEQGGESIILSVLHVTSDPASDASISNGCANVFI